MGERAKVPLLGADLDVVSELLGVAPNHDAKVTRFLVNGVGVYVLDAQKRARGLYIVGASREARQIRGPDWTGDRLISQAVGRTVTVRKPQGKPTATASWMEGSVPVVARWRNHELTELRIGDARP